MQDAAGISLERSAAAGEGQRELSCQSCMQQALQYHYLNHPNSFFVNKEQGCKKKLFCKLIFQYDILVQSLWLKKYQRTAFHTVNKSCYSGQRLFKGQVKDYKKCYDGCFVELEVIQLNINTATYKLIKTVVTLNLFYTQSNSNSCLFIIQMLKQACVTFAEQRPLWLQ